MKNNEQTEITTNNSKWNTILGLIIIATGLIVIGFIIKYIGIGISSFVSWLGTIASKVEAVVLVALITGAVSIIGVVFTSVIAKIIDYKQKRRDYLAKKREKPYAEFVDMVYKIQEYSKKNEKYPEDEMLADMFKFSRQLTLWGSNRVIKKWIKFRLSSIEGLSAVDVMFVMEDILYAMRRDMGLYKLKEGKLLSFFVNDIGTVKRTHK